MASASAVDRVEDELAKVPEEVRGVLYGYNCGKPIAEEPVPEAVAAYAKARNFQVVVARAQAAPEQSRPPRRVRIGLVQNRIVRPTTAPVREQWEAICARLAEMVDAAAMLGVNVICFQEAFHMPFAFCTREKMPSV